MLGDVEGQSALDLFAGTGALGIEALSRGAARAVFVERDERAARVLAANLAELTIAPEQAELRHANAAGVLRGACERGEAYDLIFIDPPYGEADRWGPKLSARLPALMTPRARVIAESDRRNPLRIELPIATERRYGDTSITIHTCTCPDQTAR